jgi:hypothetical protein
MIILLRGQEKRVLHGHILSGLSRAGGLRVGAGPDRFPGDFWKSLPDDMPGEGLSSAIGGEEATNHIFMYWKNDPPSGNTNA